MGKQVIIRDANKMLRVMDVDRIMEYLEGSDMNVLGLSIEAIKALKKWFYKFGGVPSQSAAIDVDRVFSGVFEEYQNSPILENENGE